MLDYGCSFQTGYKLSGKKVESQTEGGGLQRTSTHCSWILPDGLGNRLKKLVATQRMNDVNCPLFTEAFDMAPEKIDSFI